MWSRVKALLSFRSYPGVLDTDSEHTRTRRRSPGLGTIQRRTRHLLLIPPRKANRDAVPSAYVIAYGQMRPSTMSVLFHNVNMLWRKLLLVLLNRPLQILQTRFLITENRVDSRQLPFSCKRPAVATIFSSEPHLVCFSFSLSLREYSLGMWLNKALTIVWTTCTYVPGRYRLLFRTIGYYGRSPRRHRLTHWKDLRHTYYDRWSLSWI